MPAVSRSADEPVGSGDEVGVEYRSVEPPVATLARPSHSRHVGLGHERLEHAGRDPVAPGRGLQGGDETSARWKEVAPELGEVGRPDRPVRGGQPFDAAEVLERARSRPAVHRIVRRADLPGCKDGRLPLPGASARRDLRAVGPGVGAGPQGRGRAEGCSASDAGGVLAAAARDAARGGGRWLLARE